MRIRTILQGFVTQFEGQPLGWIHGLGLLGGDSEKRGVERRNIFLDLKGPALAASQRSRPVSGMPTHRSNRPAHCAYPGVRHLGDKKHRCCIGPSAPRSRLIVSL